MTDGNAAVMDAPEVATVGVVEVKKGRLLTSAEFRQSYETRLCLMTNRQVIGEVRRQAPMTSLGGGIEGLVLRIEQRHSFGNDPYCLRGPKRAKIGRAK